MTHFVCANCKKVAPLKPNTIWLNGKYYCCMNCRNQSVKKKQGPASTDGLLNIE